MDDDIIGESREQYRRDKQWNRRMYILRLVLTVLCHAVLWGLGIVLVVNFIKDGYGWDLLTLGVCAVFLWRWRHDFSDARWDRKKADIDAGLRAINRNVDILRRKGEQ